MDDPDSEAFPVVATVNIIEDYVMFADGIRCEIDTYLDGLDGVVEDGEDAAECIIAHPDYTGFLIITIDPEPVALN